MSKSFMHDGRAIVRDGNGTLVVMDEHVHVAGAEGGSDDVDDDIASIAVFSHSSNQKQ